MKVRVNWRINGGCRGECINWAHTILVHLDHLKQDQTFGLMRGPGIRVLGHNLKCYGCIYNPISYREYRRGIYVAVITIVLLQDKNGKRFCGRGTRNWRNLSVRNLRRILHPKSLFPRIQI